MFYDQAFTPYSNDQDQSFSCAKKQGLAAYCAGGNIIVRCSNGIGYAGNCNDNLAGEPPLGDNGLAGCYQSSAYAGDAACTKAGLVYPASGSGATNYNKTTPFPIPGSVAGTNVTSSIYAGPASAQATNFATGALTGNAGVAYTTIWTTSVVVTDCGDGTATAVRTAAPVLASGDVHHWANASSTITVASVPSAAAAQPVAATLATTSSASTSLPASASASASASTNGSAFAQFTGAAAASGPSGLAPMALVAAALAALALL